MKNLSDFRYETLLLASWEGRTSIEKNYSMFKIWDL